MLGLTISIGGKFESVMTQSKADHTGGGAVRLHCRERPCGDKTVRLLKRKE